MTFSANLDTLQENDAAIELLQKKNMNSPPTHATTKKFLKSGHFAIPFDEDTKKSLHYKFNGVDLNLVRLQPGGLVLSEAFLSMHDHFFNFQFRPSDVVVMTYPKCGTTWTQEIVWTMKHNPDLNNPMAAAPIDLRSLCLETDSWVGKGAGPPCEVKKSLIITTACHAFRKLLDCFPYVLILLLVIAKCFPKSIHSYCEAAMQYCPSLLTATIKAVIRICPEQLRFYKKHDINRDSPHGHALPGFFYRLCENMDNPRIFKTHIPFSLFPSNMLLNTKIIFVLRNPKDMLVSLYHYSKLATFLRYTGTFTEFIDSFISGHTIYGNYALYLKEVMARRGNPNLHIVWYEDLISDPIKEITKLDKFIGTQLTYQQIKKIAEYTSFSEMKKREVDLFCKEPTFNANVAMEKPGFFRKGVVGDWKFTFTPELSAKVDDWIKQNIDITGLEFKYGD